MENNNQDLLCCVRDMFGGCAGTPSSPNLRYMFAAVMQKDTDGCFSLKTSPVLESFDIVDCNNTISTVQSSGVVIEGVTAPIPVCIQGEKDFEQVYKCDAVTGNTILIRTVLDQDANVYVTTYYDLVVGADWAGNPADLTECTSNTLESDKVKLCDDNGEFYRWFVKDNGEPTGVSYDTDLSGAPYVPVGAVVECSDPTITLLPVCDVLTAVIGGTVPYTFATPYNVAIDYSTVTIANDTAILYWTDFGDGYSDVGPSPDHTYEADGHYDIKSYVVTASGNKILIVAKEITILAGVVTVNGANPHVVNRSYSISVGSAMQEYSGTTPVGTPINPDGSAYTVQGTLAWSCPVVIDELEDNAEWNPENVADLVECVVGSANLVTEALDVNLGAIKEVVNPGSTLTTFHTLLGNNLDIQGDGLTNIMGAGINANISGSTYIGAQFTYTFNFISKDDPGDPADFGITVWDNVAGTSVTATSITSTATYAGDAQGSGLNVPFYGWGAPGTYTIVWTGDLPVGDYTIGYMNQNFSPADHVELQVTHNLVDSMTTTKAQLVALDQCTINALTPAPSVETDLIKTNWLPLCVDGVQWYVSEKSTFDNSTSIESSVTKIYKQGANGVVTNIAPVGTNISEGYCVSSTTCGAVGDVNLIPTKLLSHTEIDTIMFNLLGVNVGKQYADLPSTAFPQTINYQGTTGNIFFGYNLNTSKYKCGTSVIANFTIMYTPLGDADPSPGDTGLDIIFLATNPSAVTLPFNSIISGTAFPPYPTQVITKLYPALPTTVQTIGASYDITGFDSINILSYVQGISAVDKVRIEGIMVEIVSGDFTDCYFVAPVKECNSSSILDAIKQQTAQVTNKIQRVHENYVVTGTTPTIIPAGAIAISVTKTNNTGVINISGDNATAFPLTFNRENFTDSVNESVSTLSAYTITGTLAGTTFKVHIIR